MTSVTSFHPVSVCSFQGGVLACQATVHAWTAGQVIAVDAPSPQQPVNQPTGCFAAGGADVCVAGVCVMTPNTLETSVRGVLFVKAPANHTGTCRFLFATTKHDGSIYTLYVIQAGTDALSISFSTSIYLSFRKCVDCHLSHGLTQKEAGHCNNTCAPLVGYMDDVSGTATADTASFACLWI